MMKTRISTSFPQPDCARDIALRCSRPCLSGRNSGSADGAARHPYPAQRGVALVITLILLAVITTLAIAFLALTYRETAAVDSLARTTDSEMACDSALERAKAEILAPFGRNDTNNAYKFPWATNGIETMGPDFMVSVGWHTNRLLDDPTTPFNELTNQFLNPTPPVFVNTNRASGPQGPFEDRFYLDLNRNRYFEETGYVQDTLDNFQGVPGVTNWRGGDPQWIGVLQDPRRPHAPDNRFIYRYAYLVQPIGRSLDLNWIHNQAIAGRAVDGYFRNQGVGGWEVNLAAFLTDVNTNEWNNRVNLPYSYTDNPLPGGISGQGLAFTDARSLVNYRYDANRTRLNTVNDLFPGVGAFFKTDQIDAYANGFTGPAGNPNVDDDPSQPWPGSDSRKHYFSVHDLWGKLPDPLGFTNQLMRASRLGNSYDRYTYYRMLSQLGTDSAEEEDGKVNINYINVRSWLTGEQIRSTDLIPWTSAQLVNVSRLGRQVDLGRPGPELFFMTVVTNLLIREPDLAFIVTNARPFADRNRPFGIPLRIPIFTNGSTFSTNLPFPGPLYSGRIHQILQLAANIHDATTGAKNGEVEPYFPSVFRPQFDDQRSIDGKVYITNYVLVQQALEVTPPGIWRDLDSRDALSGPNDLVYGIPLVIGARKGHPNFNEVAVMTIGETTRKVTVFRSVSNAEPHTIEQDLSLKIRTKIQVEARNPWDRTNARPLQLVVALNAGLQVSNGPFVVPNRIWSASSVYNYPVYPAPGYWPGESKDAGSQRPTNSYVLSPVFETNVLDWAIRQNVLNSTTNLSTNFTVTINNRLNFYILDRDSNGRERIVDFVTLNRPRNLFEFGKKMDEDLPNENNGYLAKMWSSVLAQNTSLGIANQLAISQNGGLVGNNIWGDYLGADVPSKTAAAVKFGTFMREKGVGTNQAPFTPTRLIVQANYYQVDDPLVHYTFEDLRNDETKEVYQTEPLNSARTNLIVSMGQPNPNALAWNRGDIGVPDGSTSIPGEGVLDPRLRDPGLLHPEYWDFPTGPFANVGWLGRVHRGTPWQSVYLKSRAPNSIDDWRKHSGNQRHLNCASLMIPPRDWELLDIFTTAPHPNATRGRLSINQTNLAAWSAVLSGAVTSEPIPHPDDPSFTAATNVIMAPAAIDPAIARIVDGINLQRELVSSNRYDKYLFAPFNKLGDLLSTPELSDGSPFLNVDPNRFDGYKPSGTAIVSDADYERIPQQILSLVKLGEPRFVVYAWGQSLKPARRNPEDTGPSIVTSGPERGLCRNYQITGEMATRAVIRVEFDRITDPLSPQYNQLDYSRPRAVVESFNILPVE